MVADVATTAAALHSGNEPTLSAVNNLWNVVDVQQPPATVVDDVGEDLIEDDFPAGPTDIFFADVERTAMKDHILMFSELSTQEGQHLQPTHR